MPHLMTEDSTTAALVRIERALSRIEAAAHRNAAGLSESDARYYSLRNRTQAALTTLESVIAKVGGQR